MERESFENEEVANLLNENFVSIKVDREERPDIDHVYMMVCQGLTGHGGWPLTIIMTPDKEAFFAATYLPKDSRGGMNGLVDLLPRIAELWKVDRQRVINSGEAISNWLRNQGEGRSDMEVTEESVSRAFNQFVQVFDMAYGGFGTAPKFPTPHNLLFLLRYYYYHEDERALGMIEKTLDSMYRGGIYDHIGFGFARYSTDREWLVPHFEKMLYDNALLAITYLEAYQLTGKELYAKVAREIFTYVLRDMTSPEGGFYSAEDADSEGEEGKFYTWTREEIIGVLAEEGLDFCERYDISEQGNFDGKNIPNLIRSSSQTSEGQMAKIDAQRNKLFTYREGRVHPLRDDKILTGWNGLMIAALSMGARILGDKLYLIAAEKAVKFICQKMRRPDGRLLARYRDNEAAYPAYAADYAYLIWGLLELYEAGFNSSYLQTAFELNNDLTKYFWDKENGGLFFYGDDSEELIIQPKEGYDGAIPSGNAVATLNFLRLARISGDSCWQEKTDQQFKFFADIINSNPTAYSFWLIAAMYQLYPAREIVMVGKRSEKETDLMLNTVNSRFIPDTITLLKAEGEETGLETIASYLKEMNSINGQTTAYICENYACQPPVTDTNELNAMLGKNLP